MENNKRKYAKFLLEGCLKLKKGDKLFIVAYDLIKDFVDIIKEEAKKIGIEEIDELISSPEKQKELYLSKSYEEIIADPMMDRTKYNKRARENYAFLILTSSVPGLFDEVDKKLLGDVSKYQRSSIKEFREYQQKGLIKWNISAVPNEIWALDLYKDKDTTKLWNYIFDICLIREDNPIKAWEEKINILEKRCEYLNNLGIKKLIYRNSLGTNLEIGLPCDYLFCSASGINIVNMPTEEVFTSPNKLEVNGIVYSSKPLLYNGIVIDKFYLEFKNGKVINYDAKEGIDILKMMFQVDDGASFLGEVALVDYNSPIENTKILFKETLIDENASCHLAIGAGFSECIKNGLEKTKEELEELGLNFSNTHVDFFIGTSDLEIKAVLQNNQEIVIMEKGNFKGGVL